MKKSILILTLGVGVFIGGCKKDFLTSLANNPNTPSSDKATPQLVLPAALENTDRIVQTSFNMATLWFGILNWKGGYAISTNSLSYIETTNSDNGSWFSLYNNASNYNFIEEKAKATPDYDYYVAIAKIMKAVDFEYLVDNFNDVPYTAALNAAAGTAAAFFPKYDKGQDIYTSIVNQLDSAMSIIGAAKGNNQEILPGNDDVMFGGNMALWASFANTVKLRILLQQSEVASQASYIKGEIAKTSSVPYLGPGQNAFVQPGYANQVGPNGGNQENQFYLDYGFDQNGNPNLFYPEQGAGQTGINFLVKTNDSVRLGLFYTTLPDTNIYQGDYFGLLPAGSISNTGKGLLQGPTQPAIILSACESLFMQAEAALRGWIPGNAEIFYQDAITESFAYLNGDYKGYTPGNAGAPSATSSSEADDYYSQSGVPDVSWTGGFNQELRDIIMQKWIAMSANCPMVYWNDYRRFQDITNADGTTGLPDVPLSKIAGLKATHIPFRVFYPQDEYNKNAGNVPPTSSANTDSKIFWMPQ